MSILDLHVGVYNYCPLSLMAWDSQFGFSRIITTFASPAYSYSKKQA